MDRVVEGPVLAYRCIYCLKPLRHRAFQGPSLRWMRPHLLRHKCPVFTEPIQIWTDGKEVFQDPLLDFCEGR